MNSLFSSPLSNPPCGFSCVCIFYNLYMASRFPLPFQLLPLFQFFAPTCGFFLPLVCAFSLTYSCRFPCTPHLTSPSPASPPRAPREDAPSDNRANGPVIREHRTGRKGQRQGHMHPPRCTPPRPSSTLPMHYAAAVIGSVSPAAPSSTAKHNTAAKC